jgi:Mrp family chromosome partitioning ATPase
MSEKTGKKILIACKDGTVRDNLCSALIEQGFEVYSTGNGSDALQIALFRLPHLLILCSSLDVIPADTLVKIIRTNPKTRNIPIIGLIHADVDAPPHVRGASAFLREPVSTADLISQVAGILGEQFDEGKERAPSPREISSVKYTSEFPEGETETEREDAGETLLSLEDFVESARTDSGEIPAEPVNDIWQNDIGDQPIVEPGIEPLAPVKDKDGAHKKISFDQPGGIFPGREKRDSEEKGTETADHQKEGDIAKPAVSSSDEGELSSVSDAIDQGETIEDSSDLLQKTGDDQLKLVSATGRSPAEIAKEAAEAAEQLVITPPSPDWEDDGEKERKGAHLRIQPVQHPQIPVSLEMEEELTELYNSLDLLLPSAHRKVIQFTGCQVGEGTSTIARQFALVSALKFGKKVLLMDADFLRPSQHLCFDVTPEYSLEEVIRDEQPLQNAFFQPLEADLYVTLVSNNASAAAEMFQSFRDTDLFDILKVRFDLIIIDSPPAIAFPKSLVFSNRSDGVLLVVDGESTRRIAATRVRDRIRKKDGTILGILFNKKRHHISKFI